MHNFFVSANSFGLHSKRVLIIRSSVQSPSWRHPFKTNRPRMNVLCIIIYELYNFVSNNGKYQIRIVECLKSVEFELVGMRWVTEPRIHTLPSQWVHNGNGDGKNCGTETQTMGGDGIIRGPSRAPVTQIGQMWPIWGPWLLQVSI